MINKINTNNPFNKHFKYIYVIYMPNREKYIKHFFNNLNIKVKYIPAVNRDYMPSLSNLLHNKIINKFFLFKRLNYEVFPKVSIEEFEKSNDPKIIAKLRGIKGAIGLQLTYLKIFEEFTKLPPNIATKCIIFEDDLILPKYLHKNILFSRFDHIFTHELNNVNWDIINFGRCNDLCKLNNQFSKNLVNDTNPWCTHAVAYSRKIAEETLLNSIPLSHTGDWLMAWFYYANPVYKCFSVKNRFFDQNPTLGTMLDHPDQWPECKDIKGSKPLKIKKI